MCASTGISSVAKPARRSRNAARASGNRSKSSSNQANGRPAAKRATWGNFHAGDGPGNSITGSGGSPIAGPIHRFARCSQLVAQASSAFAAPASASSAGP
ncbi:hypothetical protein [Amycolatopsis sp. cmx-4-61]|uniref:hypothetical protein n=1 Tax=Amycolatopsis sp. cmx-4-61 TaxID=2790937 RepID=UPI003978BB9D